MPDADFLPEFLTQQSLRDLLIGERGTVTGGGKGLGVRQLGTDVTITNQQRSSVRRFKFWALIVASLGDGPNKWIYNFKEARVVLGSPPTWADVPSGYTQLDFGQARNRYEWANTASGRQLNGIDVDNLPGTFALQPIQPDLPVEITAFLAQIPGEDTTGWAAWFGEPNAVDGECPPPGGIG